MSQLEFYHFFKPFGPVDLSIVETGQGFHVKYTYLGIRSQIISVLGSQIGSKFDRILSRSFAPPLVLFIYISLNF